MDTDTHAADTNAPAALTSAALTDLGNAERLVALHGSDLRYCVEKGAWLLWDGTRWVVDDGLGVRRLAHDTIRATVQAARRLDNDQLQHSLLRHARASERRARITAMIDTARALEGMAVRRDALDSHPGLLNLRNGTYDLEADSFRGHAREDLLTRIAPVAYDPGAECPRWRRFVAEVTGGDDDLIEFLQRWVGYCLTGDTSEQKLALIIGPGANGKSTFVGTIREMLGDYAASADFGTFQASRKGGDTPRADLVRLDRVRIVSAVESGADARLDETIIKMVTGGDPLVARPLYGQPIEFEPEFTLTLVTNAAPRIDGVDYATWRRILVIPLDVVFDPEGRRGPRPDPTLRAQLRREMPGILAWALEGFRAWRRDGLGLPSAVRRATADLRRQASPLRCFLEDCAVEAAGATTPTARLYRAYEAWCDRNGVKSTMNAIAFGKRLSSMGIEAVKSGGERCRRGIELRDPPLDR